MLSMQGLVRREYYHNLPGVPALLEVPEAWRATTVLESMSDERGLHSDEYSCAWNFLMCLLRKNQHAERQREAAMDDEGRGDL